MLHLCPLIPPTTRGRVCYNYSYFKWENQGLERFWNLFIFPNNMLKNEDSQSTCTANPGLHSFFLLPCFLLLQLQWSLIFLFLLIPLHVLCSPQLGSNFLDCCLECLKRGTFCTSELYPADWYWVGQKDHLSFSIWSYGTIWPTQYFLSKEFLSGCHQQVSAHLPSLISVDVLREGKTSLIDSKSGNLRTLSELLPSTVVLQMEQFI